MRRFATLRFRITALATVVVVVVLVLAGAGVVAAQKRSLTEDLNENLSQAAANIEAAIEGGQVPKVLGGFGDDDALAQIVAADGEVLAATPNVPPGEALAPFPPKDRTEVLRTVERTAPVEGTFRVASRTVATPDGVLTVHVAGTLDDIEDSARALVSALTVAIPLVAVLMAGLVWWLVGRTLRPVEAIRAEVADIGGSDLHRRVPEPPGGDEIAGLARTMNEMLDRLDEAARRQQRFVADASHELRGPLTRIRSELEVDLAYPEGADLAATHRSMLEEADGLQRLVADLLALARSDAGALVTPRDPVALDDVARRVAAELPTRDGVRVDVAAAAPVEVAGDADQLARAIRNIAENAVRHASSVVTMAVASDGGDAVLSVEDDGPGIPPDERERVFERFARLDESRTGATGGAGLGLAIARDIATGHGGTLTVEPGEGSGARLVLRLPARR